MNQVPDDKSLVEKMKAMRLKDAGEASWPDRIKEACKIRLVVAAGIREFKAWCRDRKQMPGVEAIFIQNSREGAERIRGRSRFDYEMVLIGTVRKDTVNQDIFDAAKYLGISIREG